MTQTADHWRKRAEQNLPAFASRRVDAHYIDRFRNLWGGDHLLHGACCPPDALMMMSNDYLDLLSVQSLRSAQARSLGESSQELVMSAVFLHGETAQEAFERKLAAFMAAEDGVLCQSGWSANVGLIQTLAEHDVPVYLDLAAHASLWEGARSAGAKAVRFAHNNVAHARIQVARHGPGVIAVDAVYSTNGSVAPLSAFAQLAKDTGCVLVVDESHSLGTHGPAGSGLVCGLGLSDRVHFRTASLAKSFAGRAGFVTCSTEFKGFFKVESRAAIFSSGLLAHELAWFEAALPLVATSDSRRTSLHRIARKARDALSGLGYNVSEGSEQIIALEAGTEPQTMLLRDALQRRGVFGAVFCYPATPKNRSLVRLSFNASHTEADVAHLVEACADMRGEVELGSWSSTKRIARVQTGDETDQAA